MENVHQFIKDRANKRLYWWSSDSQKNYKPITDFGANIYKPFEFAYDYNSDGFRCDEFNLPSDIPIVFIGCSSTEGTGLPIGDVWAHRLINRIRTATGKNIPYWNLAASGTGIDTMANNLYRFTRTTPIKYIFAYFPDFSRRDYKFKNNYMYWASAFSRNEYVDRLFVDQDFSDHQSERSLMIIDSIREANNAKIWSSSWSSDIKPIHNYPELKFFNSRHQAIDTARDSVHHGPAYHRNLELMYWIRCRSFFTNNTAE